MINFDFALRASLSKIIFAWLLFLPCNVLKALVVGSNTAPSRQALVTFPVAGADNEMRGFAAFENGFALEGASTTCLYNDFFPVSGDITLNGGTLTLAVDLTISQTACFVSAGKIYGNNHICELPPHNETFVIPTGSAPVSLAFIDDIDTGDIVYEVAWSYDNQFLAVGREWDGITDELRVYSFDGSTITFEGSDFLDYGVYDVDWHPTATYYLAVARQYWAGENELWIYSFDGSTLNLSDTDAYGDNATAVSWHPSGNYLAVGTWDDTQEIIIYSFSTATGLITSLTTYNLGSNQDVSYAAMDWDPGGNYLAVGVTIGIGPELLVFYFDGATLTLTVSQELGRSVQALDWLPSGTFLITGLDAGTESVRFYEHYVSDGTLTEKTSARIGRSTAVHSIHWRRPQEDYLAVAGPVESGTELKVYTFNKSAFMLSYETGVETGAAVNTVRWSHNGQYVSFNDSSDFAAIYGFLAPTNRFLFDSLCLVLNSPVEFVNGAQFNNNCSIEGREHDISFDDDSDFAVGNCSTLHLENLTFSNLIDGKLYCLDSFGTVSLSNVRFLLDSDFSLTVGRFDIVGDVWITGTNVFIYQTDQMSTIASNATLHFDSGMTFSYASRSARNLLAMEDETAMLHLYEATLYSVAPGLQLTKGTLVIEGECAIESDATMHDDGVTVGDGSSASNNVTVKILPESGPNTITGWLNYKNV